MKYGYISNGKNYFEIVDDLKLSFELPKAILSEKEIYCVIKKGNTNRKFKLVNVKDSDLYITKDYIKREFLTDGKLEVAIIVQRYNKKKMGYDISTKIPCEALHLHKTITDGFELANALPEIEALRKEIKENKRVLADILKILKLHGKLLGIEDKRKGDFK